MESHARAGQHQRALSILSVSQPTESGTLYSPQDLEELCELAHGNNMKVHMDGARFSNALVALGVSAADCSWRRGVDVLSFGTTKNGTLNAEAVISFDGEISRRLKYLQKRAGYLTSKMRYQAVQLLAFLENDLWLDSAKQGQFACPAASRRVFGSKGCRRSAQRRHQPTLLEFVRQSRRAFERSRYRVREWETGGFRLVTSYCDEDAVETVERALRARSS